MSTADELISTNVLMQKIAKLKNLCDVTLVSGIDNQKFSAHRLILIASSEYFAALLGPNFREGTEKEILLKEIDGSSLQKILDFIYSGRIEITAENVADIVATASRLELITLEERCGKCWEAHLSIENCVEFLLNADQYHLNDLRSKTLKFICDHFEAVPLEDIRQLDKKHLRELLENDQIISAESVVFERLVQWMEQNKIEAGEVASEMLKLIRLDHISFAFLTETVEPFFEKYGCEKMVWYECRKRFQDSKTINLHRYAPKMVYCSSLNATDNEIEIRKYDFAENKWNEFKSISLGAARRSFGSIFVNGELFVMGGYVNDNISSKVESYNVNDSTKTVLLPMEIGRVDFTPICIGKYIYAFGGLNHSVCERFDIEKRVWQSCKSLPVCLHDYTAVEFNGKIYVAKQNFPYCYDPARDSWTELASLNAGAQISSLIKSNEILYAIESNCTIHRYDVNQSKWTTIGWFGNFDKIFGAIDYCNQTYILSESGHSKVLKFGENCTFIQLKETGFESLHKLFLLFSF